MYSTVQYCSVQYSTVLHGIVLYSTLFTVQLIILPLTLTAQWVRRSARRSGDGSVCIVYYNTVYCTVIQCTLLYFTVMYFTVLYCTVLYLTVFYYTVLYCTFYLILVGCIVDSMEYTQFSTFPLCLLVVNNY